MPSEGVRPTVGIADVFCGAGGLTYGVTEAIREAGMTPRHILAMDTDPLVLDGLSPKL